MGARQEHRLEDRRARRWPLVAGRLRQQAVHHDLNRGGACRWSRGSDHLNFDLTPHYFHPDSVGVDHKNALKVLAYDARDGTLLWQHTPYNGLMYDNRHRKNTYESGTM